MTGPSCGGQAHRPGLDWRVNYAVGGAEGRGGGSVRGPAACSGPVRVQKSILS